MRIEVLLVDQINDKINNYDENLNLFEANKFEAKQKGMDMYPPVLIIELILLNLRYL